MLKSVPELPTTTTTDKQQEQQTRTANNNNAFCQYNTGFYDSNFEIANRAFYATIDKFTKQSCPDASRRRSAPYSFLENWHLHSIYCKSQQTLLGITPVKPSVLLSGDDFMFTPPFTQLNEQEEPEDDYFLEDDSFYILSPCPGPSNLFDCEDEFYTHQHDTISYPSTTPFETSISPFNSWLTNKPPLSILIPDQQQQQQQSPEEEPELSPCSSIDENPTSTHSSITTIDEPDVVLPSTIKPMTRSFSILSHKSTLLDDNSSIMSYQSLADLIDIKNSNNYGATDREILPPPSPPSCWNRLLIYLMYVWQALIHIACFWNTNTDENQPLLP